MRKPPIWRKGFLTLLACVSCPAMPVPSTDSPPPGVPVRLTLKQAVELALKQSPRQTIARLLVMESGRNRQIAVSTLLPQAGIAVDGQIRRYNIQTVLGGARPAAVGPFQFIEAGPTFSQTILNLPLIRAYQASKESVREAQAEEGVTREDVVLSVVSQYLNVLRALASEEAARSQVALAERLYSQAAELQKTGIGLNIDTVRANVELQNQRQGLIDAETSVRTNTYVLAELLNLSRDQLPEPADRLQFFDLPNFDVTSLEAQALKRRPEVRSIESQQRIAQLARKAASDERFPQLAFGGDWLYQGKHFTDGIPAYTYALSLQMPVFTSGRIRAEIERAGLEEQKLAEDRKLLENRIVREVRSAVDQLEAARKAVDAANLGLKLANEEVAQADRRFRAGVSTNIEVITAQDQLARASDNQIQALYRFNQSRANLARATGDVEGTFTK